MSFINDVPNEGDENQKHPPLRKKLFFPISDSLRRYLKLFEREVNLPVTYDDLYRINYSVPE